MARGSAEIPPVHALLSGGIAGISSSRAARDWPVSWMYRSRSSELAGVPDGEPHVIPAADKQVVQVFDYGDGQARG